MSVPDLRPGKYRVVRIIARLNVGGPAHHVMNLSEGLSDAFPTLLVTGAVDEGEADVLADARARGIDVLFLPELGRSIRPGNDLVAILKLVRLLRKVRPEIVHTHTAKAGTLGRLAARAARVPIVIHTFHGHIFRNYFGPRKSQVFVRIERGLARLTDCVIAISASQRLDLLEEFRICEDARLRVVPLGLDLRKFTAPSVHGGSGFRAELDAGDSPVVTIVGRLAPVKNHEFFLRAAAAIIGRNPKVIFAIVGGGCEEERLRQLATELDVDANVRFMGWRFDLEEVYAGSDVVVLTSLEEGTPVAVIEALAAGRPVVSTEVGGVRDLAAISELVKVVQPGDVSGFTNAVAAWIDAPPSPELRSATSARVALHYSHERLVRDIRLLYEEHGVRVSRRRHRAVGASS